MGLFVSLFGIIVSLIFIGFAIQDTSIFLLFCDLGIGIFSLIFGMFFLIATLVELKSGYDNSDDDRIEPPENKQHYPNMEGSSK